jgi:hypothetical protein
VNRNVIWLAQFARYQWQKRVTYGVDRWNNARNCECDLEWIWRNRRRVGLARRARLGTSGEFRLPADGRRGADRPR